ncbi:NVEALA domain-containing protein [Proteiniphilum saccharofermentans]|uniref:NVEALA domain-containing protein n=1 Tax=Proteiniphilum saccharofermentans TaxID=1642647 RepID=UPI0028AD33C8|nr:NVEALA domain-containing protein [Proteiniphilum saccharofermentans]
MKKKIFVGIAVLAMAAIAAFNVNLNTNSEVSLLTLANVEALAQCENKVEVNGQIITTTVCNRKTSTMDRLSGYKCATEASTSCQFTNYNP